MFFCGDGRKRTASPERERKIVRQASENKLPAEVG
jgi:hypothetical protein